MTALSSKLSFSRLRPAIEIMLWRHGLLPVLAGGILIGAVIIWAWLLPVQYGKLEQSEARLQAVELAASTAGPVSARVVSPYRRFQQTLSRPADTNNIVREIFAIAQESGVFMSQAEYRRLADTHRTYSQLQIAMPVRGNYAAFKRFSQLLLQRIPSISIDQMNVRRDASNSLELEVQVILSLWQTPAGNAGAAPAPAARAVR